MVREDRTHSKYAEMWVCLRRNSKEDYVTSIGYARGSVTGDEVREVIVWRFCRLHSTFSQVKDFGFFSEQGGKSLDTFQVEEWSALPYFSFFHWFLVIWLMYLTLSSCFSISFYFYTSFWDFSVDLPVFELTYPVFCCVQSAV